MVEIGVESSPDGQRVRVAGTLDVRCAPDARLLMHQLIDSAAGPILLDLADCQVRDSTAFGLLVELLRRAGRAQRPLLIIAADERTRRLLRRARLAGLLSADPALAGTATASRDGVFATA